MTNIHTERLQDQLKALAGRFLQYEGNNSSLITVTNVMVSKDQKNAMIYFTVFPESYEKTALEFALRKRSDFKQYVRDESKINRIPHLDFALDMGEKHRQRIDQISQEIG